MSNKEKIFKIVKEKGRVSSSELTNLLQVSRQYINLVMSDFIAQKKVIKLGATRNAYYVSAEYAKNNSNELPNSFKKKYKNISLEEHRVLMEIEERLLPLASIPENIKSIFTFAFSEMFNNAIEHSQAKVITTNITLHEDKLKFIVEDSGIGVFRNIMKKRELASEVEAIQDLLKGKTTTMPKSHSGEGIFFTSKVADTFLLDSFEYELAIGHGIPKIKQLIKRKRGTRVIFEIDINSSLHLNDIFKKYTNQSQNSDYGFDKTEIRVKLYTTSGVHISRSQARRILSGLEKFQIIILDFDQVPIIGQAFADEIYRVFHNTYPHIEIKEENVSEGVEFMIERSKNEAKKSL